MTRHKKALSFKRGFKKPTSEQILKTINAPFSAKKLKKFNNFNDKLETLVKRFKLVPDPTDELDYLAQLNDSGQDFEEFEQDCPHEMNKFGFIYYIRVGEFKETKIDFGDLIDYSKCFFSEAAVKKMDLSIDIKIVKHERAKHGFLIVAFYEKHEQIIEFRYHEETEKIQLYCESFHRFLSRIKPKDACCLVGLTEYDLYLDDSDLFIAGLAKGDIGVAVFSYSRYDPTLKYSEEFWYDTKISSRKKTIKQGTLFLNRTCKLLVHETLHLLGFDHCIYMDCCMNGSGHLQEDFRQSMFLCPIDLKKMMVIFDFELIERYKKMQEFFERHKSTTEVKWLQKSIELIKNDD